MRRTIFVAGAVLLLVVALAPAAVGGSPKATVTRVVQEPTTFTALPGELCDFTYQQTYWGTYNLILVGDPVRMEIDAGPVSIVHMNLDTGDTLTEPRSAVNYKIDLVSETMAVVGVFWHLRNADGDNVLVQAGRQVIDINTGEVYSYTPNINPDFGGVICPLLGGSPA